MFDKGVASILKAQDFNRKTKVSDYKLKHLDFSKESEPDSFEVSLSPRSSYQQTINTSKKPAPKASPNQTQSYINTGNVVDSLENRRRLMATHVMSSPVHTAMPHQLVAHAKKTLLDNNVSHIVIVNAQGNPLGMISAKDISKVASPESSFIQKIFDAKAMAVTEDTLVREIALSFIRHKIKVLTVVNDSHQVTGIVSQSDLLSLLVNGPNQVVTA
jgi:CBS domain-containing protein